jgi:hypothetical protein
MGALNVLLNGVSGTRGPLRNTVGSYFRVSRFCKILKITHKTFFSPLETYVGKKSFSGFPSPGPVVHNLRILILNCGGYMASNKMGEIW